MLQTTTESGGGRRELPSGVRGRAPAENGFSAFQPSQKSFRSDVCRKCLTFCQKTFINGNERQQEAPLPRRAQRVRRALLVYFMTFLGRESVDG